MWQYSVAEADPLRTLKLHLCGLGLPDAAIEYITQCAIDGPSRRVGEHRVRNLVLDVPLNCVPGVCVQAESLTGEYMFLCELEYRHDVLAILDQPNSVPIEITDRLGRKTRSFYTADYLVIYEAECVIYEVKPDSELQRLVGARPSDWVFSEGQYSYLPATKVFSRLGISFRVIPTSSLDPMRIDNLRRLVSARRAPERPGYSKARAQIDRLLSLEEPLTISEIMSRLELVDTTPILQLLDQERAFADLDHATLSDRDSVWIAKSPELARQAQSSSRGLVDYLQNAMPTSHELVEPRYELELATRLAIATGKSETNRRGAKISERSKRRYKKKLKDAGGDASALIPEWAACGKTGPRLSQLHLFYLRGLISDWKTSPNDRNAASCYRFYRNTFDAERDCLNIWEQRPISKSTFYEYWNGRLRHTTDFYGQGGRRRSNQLADSYDPANKTLLATRPFAVAHIDHWNVELHLVVGERLGEKVTAKPWLSAMVDMFTGEVLAIWLSFAAPSKKSCTMVIRDCVRRHGRLPEMIVVDGGSDFRSTHFFVMLMTFGVVRAERPPEDPRFGVEVERLFATFKERFARGLPGYGISISRAREVSAAFKAARTASFSLLEAFEILEAYVFQGYNHSPKADLRFSRISVREAEMAAFPHSGRLTEWNLKFLVATSIEASGDSYKLTGNRGLHVNGKWYSSPSLLAYRGYKKDITVRIEPFADSIIYVSIDSKWIVCRNSGGALEDGLSERSLIFKSAQAQDLRALKDELRFEADRTAAMIVNDKLEEIALRKIVSSSDDQLSSRPEDEGQNSVADFSNVVPYDDEDV